MPTLTPAQLALARQIIAARAEAARVAALYPSTAQIARQLGVTVAQLRARL